MKIKCEYCGNYINDTDEVCKNCGGVNENLKRVANGVPTTIEELKLFCKAHNLPLENMRFFIGENYELPKAFGIYKDEANGEFVVYKNKADGSRAIRYRGDDEAYAVNEIYLKLKSEIQNQKIRQNEARQYAGHTSGRTNAYENSGKSRSKSLLNRFIRIMFLAMFLPSILQGVMVAFSTLFADSRPSTGYYQYNNDCYYYYDDWYKYDTDSSNWFKTTIDTTFEEDYESYYSSYSYDSSYEAYDFQDSSYYEEPDYSNDDDWDDDWDDDYDWDSGSDWDSSYSDWDSDW